jgi:hypothetical protein
MVHWWVPGQILFSFNFVKIDKMQQNYSNLHQKKNPEISQIFREKKEKKN